MPVTAPATAFARISQIASQRSVHEAFRWLHLHEQQIMRWQQELVSIAAPPFGEGPRALWLASRLHEIGLEEVHLDAIGNVIAKLPGQDRSHPCVVVSAHIDTVFPDGTPIQPRLIGTRLFAPGACDNGAGAAALLAIASALRRAQVHLPGDILFLANVGEEGEGDLRGMRYFYQQIPSISQVAAHLVLDGAGHEVAVTRALGSRRYLVTIAGPGGHSWTDAARPNPIVVLSRAIAQLGDRQLHEMPRTTLNVGTIEGGTAVNAIPERVTARFDTRSTDADQLVRLEVDLHRAVEDTVLNGNQGLSEGLCLRFSIQTIGDRPAGALPENSPLLHTLRAVDRHLSIRTETRIASTDANIPLSLGVPALSMGAGGEGGGIHTRSEWYDARGRNLGLRRILLLACSAF
ncbi:M20/M25/M40 family metallo-hydrolase [Pseudacidobacterium ailaaui]|jgi:acetylornithine deacetylase/succinyl-diaminopimelate desuccinylase-like protein|uniref:M20/M25/M40 family metallo-hydrolase n=1 Tax=Pseudacidobacterium ailaaui TaxID=1382359 RepID=UPI0004790CEE|nr:M20/M25/M40 family metallo-hydrolase [Pseudacidobacterium ailaaui]